MAAPVVSAAAALLKERHPTWTVAQIKSALEQTGDPVAGVPVTRDGGGVIDLPRADVPLLFAAPTGLSFGALRPGGDREPHRDADRRGRRRGRLGGECRGPAPD